MDEVQQIHRIVTRVAIRLQFIEHLTQKVSSDHSDRVGSNRIDEVQDFHIALSEEHIGNLDIKARIIARGTVNPCTDSDAVPRIEEQLKSIQPDGIPIDRSRSIQQNVTSNMEIQ